MKLIKNINNKNMYTYHMKEHMFVSQFKKNLIKFCLCVALFLLAILISLLPYIITQKNVFRSQQMRFPTDLKYILFWRQTKHKNPFRRAYANEIKSGQKSFIDQKCPYINCYISYNKTLLGNEGSNFDAIVFDVNDISKLKNSDFNVKRAAGQKYIFRSHESAEKQPVCNPMFDDFFTWTWTYKLDSTIPHPFVSIYDMRNQLVGPSKVINWVKNMNHSDTINNKIAKKNKGVAWIATKCRLKHKHQDFVKELKNELKGYNYSVDVFGPCGDKKCPNRSVDDCYKMVERNYYFQMVLEDSISEDYVGESIAKALNYLSVPIVLGGADYTRFLPPGTYINAKAFNIKKLGALIDYLIKNPVMYEYFFDWKNHYFYTEKHRSQVCDLCAKLNSKEDLEKTWINFRKWWNPNFADICERMHLINFFNS